MLRITGFLICLTCAALISGCTIKPVTLETDTPIATTEAASTPSSLSVDTLKNLAYNLEIVGDDPVQLTDGVYEDTANRILVNWIDSYSLGTLNGQPVAAVVLVAHTGGSGNFSYLAVVEEQDGKAVNIASTLLGDRVNLNQMVIAQDQIKIDLVTQGPNEPMCCGTQRTAVGYALEGDQLVNTATTVIGVQSQVSETQVITYVPEIMPETTQSGTCFASAIGLGRADAWRCTTDDNQIQDPCFQIDDAPTIVCGADPITGGEGFVLTLTEPLPAPDASESSMPWLVQLGDGTICGLLTGTVPGVGDQVAAYACDNEAYSNLLRDFPIVDPFWFAQSVVFDLGDEGFTIQSSVLVPVTKVWR